MVTDRRHYGTGWPEALVAQVAAAATAGVQLVQVREPDLDGGVLLQLVRDCVAAVRGTRTRVLVNDRVDVALAAGAHGVHLPAQGVDASAVRAIARPPFLVGRSVHALDEAEQAARAGQLDFLIFGTVFESDSKRGVIPAGVEALATVARAVPLPVLAIGGVTLAHLPAVRRAGAAGAAAIGLFHVAATFDTLRSGSLT
jgi:thiamine-phosphate pyrophosphorylase